MKQKKWKKKKQKMENGKNDTPKKWKKRNKKKETKKNKKCKKSNKKFVKCKTFSWQKKKKYEIALNNLCCEFVEFCPPCFFL